MSATPEPGVTPDLIANLRRRVAAAPDGRPVPLRSDVLAALLDQISPEVPEPAPAYQPGDVAIATVRLGNEMHKGELVIRTQLPDGTAVWFSPRFGTFLPEYDVTVTSRAVVVTEDAVDVLAVQLDDKWGCDDEHPEGTCTACDLISGLTGDLREWFAARLGGGR